MSTLEAQMTHASWDAAMPYDMEEDARRNPFLAAHVAACDRKYGKKKEVVEDESCA